MANYIKITKCRICGNPKLIPIGSLGMIAVSNFTIMPSEGIKMPLELIFCQKCTLVQLAHNFNRNLLYKDYWYKSGLNKAIVEDLKEIAQYGYGVHIDIGADDGTLLKYSKAEVKYGIEPSNINPGFIWIKDYFEDINMVYADVITAIACLYDLPDPNKFIANVKKHLQPDGLFISQFQPLAQMVELNDVGNICHEHLEYYSYKSLVWLFEKNGLEIFKVEKNKMNGGSYRIFARHYTTGSIRFKEKEYGVKQLKAFCERVEDTKNKFKKWIDTVDNIYCYGASTKGNSILQYYEMGDFKVIDINPQKTGKWMANYSQVISKIPKDAKYLWVFPYGFLDYFKKKEKGYKGKWITTIPKFKIV